MKATSSRAYLLRGLAFASAEVHERRAASGYEGGRAREAGSAEDADRDERDDERACHGAPLDGRRDATRSANVKELLFGAKRSSWVKRAERWR